MLDLSAASNDVIADFLEIVAKALYPKPLAISEAYEIASNQARVPEMRVNAAFQVIQKRKSLLGAKYPFLAEVNYVCQKGAEEFDVYSTLLIVSAPSELRHVPAWNIATAAKIMEHTVEKCFSGFFGSGTNTVNFGFPSEIDRPSDFSEAVAWLSRRTGIPVGAGYRAARFKDGGVDIFVWKQFPDGKPGVPLLLLQCTIQEKFADKISDVDRRLWSSWLSSDIDPVVGLCVPNIVTSLEAWNEITTRGLLFDRTRLVLMCEEGNFGLSATQKAFGAQLIDQFRESFY